MFVLKRNNETEVFDIMKIIKVLHKANKSEDINSEQIKEIANIVATKCEQLEKEKITSQEIQEFIENTLIANDYIDLAKEYITACFKKKVQKETNELDKSVLDILANKNDEVSLENSNKNSKQVTTHRDYMAGEISKSISRRLLLDEDIVKAHDDGWIHVHDLDYYASPLTNCCLCNLKDMFENGTMIGSVRIDTPKSLQTAATIATQAVASVSASQFGLN